MKNCTPIIICVMGVDGSGKSTVTEHLASAYRERGYTVDVLWLRYNHFLSKPLLGFCRLIGLTEYENIGGHRVGYHHFYRSRVISQLFIYLQYLDALRSKYQHILPLLKKERQVVILDRFTYDILVDLIVDTRELELANSWIGGKLIKLLPESATRIMIRRNWSEVLSVRPEADVDKFFRSRFDQFEKIAQESGVHVIENSGSLSDLYEKVDTLVGLSGK